MHPCCWAEMCSHVVFHSWISEDCLLLLNHQFPASRMLFPAFLKKKIHGTSEEIATLQALKRHGTVNILKVVQAVYIFSFVDLCI